MNDLDLHSRSLMAILDLVFPSQREGLKPVYSFWKSTTRPVPTVIFPLDTFLPMLKTIEKYPVICLKYWYENMTKYENLVRSHDHNYDNNNFPSNIE